MEMTNAGINNNEMTDLSSKAERIVQTAGRDALGEFAPDSWFSHLAFEIKGEEASTEWCEPVSGDDYNKLK